MNVEDDVLDLIRGLPHEINDVSIATELKFLTIGGVLVACHEEIVKLRAEVTRLKRRPSRRKHDTGR